MSGLGFRATCALITKEAATCAAEPQRAVYLSAVKLRMLGLARQPVGIVTHKGMIEVMCEQGAASHAYRQH